MTLILRLEEGPWHARNVSDRIRCRVNRVGQA